MPSLATVPSLVPVPLLTLTMGATRADRGTREAGGATSALHVDRDVVRAHKVEEIIGIERLEWHPQ